MIDFRALITLFFAMVCVVGSAAAQDEEPTEPDEAAEVGDASESADSSESTEPSPSEEVKGDILILKTGDRIEGFQILRATHKAFILEGLYDPTTEESLEIQVPRSQVAEVIRDNIEPEEERLAAKMRVLLRQRTTVQGERLSDTLYAMLERAIGEPPIETEGKNLGEVLEAVNSRVDGVLQIAPPVMENPVPWKGKIEPGTTLVSFLDDQIAPNYPNLTVVFQEELVQIRPKGPPPEGGRGGRGGPPPGAEPGTEPGEPGAPPPAAGPGGRGGRGGPPPALGPGRGGRGGPPPAALGPGGRAGRGGPPPAGDQG